MKKSAILLSLLISVFLLNVSVFAQTNPTPFDLSSGNFSFTGFTDGTITTYPASVQGHSFAAEPSSANLANEANANRVLVNSTNSITTGSIRNEVGNGLSLLNSGSNNIGAIVVALNTTGRENITVGFTAQQLNDTITRVNGLRLQYRVGTSGLFTDVSPTVEYLSALSGTNAEQQFSGIVLPAAVNNQAIVQLRWIYYASSGSGARDRIRLDEISVSSSAIPTSDVDLTISRDTFDTSVSEGGTVTFDLIVSNGGTTTANNVRATFVVPSGLTYTSATVSGGFTASEAGGTVTFDGGTIAGGDSAALSVTATADESGTLVTSTGSQTTVDPNNSIAETNETNNNANGNLQIGIAFQSPIVGLNGRPNLAQLFEDIDEIGIDPDGMNFERVVRLNQSLTNENTDIFVPGGVYLDFSVYTISGTANITFGNSVQDFGGGKGAEFKTSNGSENGAGFKTSNINGLGDATNPGSIQLSGTRTFNGDTDATYYVFLPTSVGSPAQNAYGMPTQIDKFEIDNPSGVNIFAPFEVADSLYLTNGIINNGENTITLDPFTTNNGENTGQGSSASYVNGAVEKRIFSFAPTLNGLLQCYIFPVGTVGGAQAGYSPMRMCWNSGNFGDSLKVEAFDTNSPAVTTPSLSRYWQLEETGNLNADLDFFWVEGDETAIATAADLRIFRNSFSVCTTTNNCSVDLTANTASIDGVTDFSPWTVAEFIPSAANVEVAGKVLDARGGAIANALVILTDQDGTTRTMRTNNFGNYRFDGLEAGRTYVFNARSRANTFTPQILTPQESVTDLNITAIDQP